MDIKLAILTPVYNDWDCLELLISEIEQTVGQESNLNYSILAVNDGSKQACPEKILNHPNKNIHHLELARNLGNQRAIAIGMCYLEEHFEFDYLVVMDSDGEDRPENIIQLLNKAVKEQSIAVAARGNRTNTSDFKFFYRLYKWVFKALSGIEISFGNFSVIPRRGVQQLILYSELWSHFSGAIIKSKINYVSLKIDRGERYFGQSKINFNFLILHGIASITIFMESVALRMLLFTIGMISFLSVVIGIVSYMKFFTHYPTPGWATTMSLNLLIIIFQMFSMSLLMLFLVLFNRSTQIVIPKNIYKIYIR